jgi:uncharacterized delta-60 repeat protein
MKKSFYVLLFTLITFFSWGQSVPLLWESRYTGAGDNSDKFNKIISVPGGDYVAVGFTTRNGKYKDFLTVKISGSTMDTLWTRTKGTGSGDDEAISCASDASGNIFVTGYRDGGTTQDDIYTIKYDASGTDIWDTAFNSPIDSALLDERPVDCGVDPSGNFIIAGWTEWGTWSLNQNDFLILKYDSNGSLLWRTRYNRSGFKDEATAMVIDATGDVYVTGRSAVGTDDDWVTMKLDGTTGAHLWSPVRIYSSGNGDDRPVDIALDNTGLPLITGRGKNGSGNDVYKTLKYSAAGALLLNLTTPATGGNARATSLAIDQSTNDIYVTGEGDGSLVSDDYDVMTVKYNASGIQQWKRDWAGAAQNEDVGKDIVVDPFGNILICGNTDGDPDPTHSNFDWINLKYDASGVLQYQQAVNGSRDNDDEAASLVSDAAGNAHAVGYINNTDAQKDAARVIYDPSGNSLHTLLYNGEGDFNESSHAMAQDNSGNTYIAGYAYVETDNKNIFAGKIDPSGNLVDTFLFNGSNDDDDELTDIAVDASGNVYACGYTKTNGQKSNFILIRFNSNLDTAWTRQYDFIGQRDKAVSLKVDGTGIYVTGESDADINDTLDNDDIFTIKYDAGGSVLWSQRYDDAQGWRDQPVKLILGQNNKVYVTGRNSNIHDDDIVLLAYDRTTGAVATGLYPVSWNANFSDDDRASDIIEDASGNVYVSGLTQSSFVDDYTLLKFDPTGVLLWSSIVDMNVSQEDRADALALDASGNVVVAGQTDVDADPLTTNYNYGTLIYDPAGNYVCPSAPFMYNGAGDGDDIPVAANVNGNEILVTGQSAEGTSTNRNKNIMTRFISIGGCADLTTYAEYDGPAGGGDAPNATILASSTLFITGSSDGSDNQKDIITLKFDVATGVNDLAKQSISATVFPNPLHTTSTLGLENFSSDDLAVKIYNVLGEVVYSVDHISSNITLDKTDFDDGVYSYQVLDGEKLLTSGRFVAN